MKKTCTLLLFFSLLVSSSYSQIRVNRYSEAKVSTKGIFGKSDVLKEVIIPAINTKKVLEKWEKEKTQRFARRCWSPDQQQLYSRGVRLIQGHFSP